MGPILMEQVSVFEDFYSTGHPVIAGQSSDFTILGSSPNLEHLEHNIISRTMDYYHELQYSPTHLRCNFTIFKTLAFIFQGHGN